ncbi:ATP-dependent nuclease [Rhizobium sp. C1]|uniref:ATP-dependent nuclease n=1 Tax=Rhizobium sp. C1 TaxID=1349799 RepID=UPI001E4B10BF|nr:AAA family ATPase [Rhizobium sp. C1]MCD2178269.1 AAA family ATPase [Rhizobium sp. C1]
MAVYVTQQNTFCFNAERMSIGESAHAHAERLTENANNLPSVLLTLQGERGDTFNKLVQHIREVFPTVGNLSVGPVFNNGNIEVRIWPTIAMPRRELSFPLNNSGTGVAQVIAILTAIMTIEDAVIVIDEINSFLHPAAVKTLLRILQTEYNQHQYIISTHSPEVISFSNPSTVHLVKRSGYESTVHKLNLNQVEDFREVADHLGISMADVFAADNVIWVEGPTEELCFPLVYSRSTNKTLPPGTAFISVVATGDLSRKKRDRQLVGEIYERLSSTGSPLVKSVKFGFDSEQLSEAEKEDMRKESKGRMHFLPRRHFECYLLDPSAITAFLNEKDGQSNESHTSELVSSKLTELAASPKFSISEWNGDLSSEAWLEKVDAAKLIGETCKALSEQRVTFNKKADSLFLLKHTLENNPNSLKSLTDYVCELVDGK